MYNNKWVHIVSKNPLII